LRARPIGEIAVTPRPLSDYRNMILLDDQDLVAGPILDCPGGASPFGAQVRARGGTAVSVDPVYDQPRDVLVERARADLDRTEAWMAANPSNFDWSYLGSARALDPQPDRMPVGAATEGRGLARRQPHDHLAPLAGNRILHDHALHRLSAAAGSIAFGRLRSSGTGSWGVPSSVDQHSVQSQAVERQVRRQFAPGRTRVRRSHLAAGCDGRAMATGGNGAPSAGAAAPTMLAAYRRRALLTQEELADRSGLSVRTIRELEAGRVRRPRRESLRLLADALRLADQERAALTTADGAVPDGRQPVPATPVCQPLVTLGQVLLRTSGADAAAPLLREARWLFRDIGCPEPPPREERRRDDR